MNSIESPEINPHLYGQLIYDKGGKNKQWGKDSLFNKWCWENCMAPCKRVKLDYFLTTHTKIKWRWIKTLNVTCKTIKFLKVNIGGTIFDIYLGTIYMYLDLFPQENETKAKLNKWDYIKLKSSCTVEGAIKKMKRQPTEWKKIFANDISDKILISNIYKKSHKSQHQQNKNSLKSEQRAWIDIFPMKTCR